MRTAFHERMDALTAQLGEMCGLAGVAMEHATQALLQADLPLAEQVITDHDRLITMRAQAEENALLLLALQAPVAGDLRAIVSSLQNVADAERMGGLALHVAKIARRRHPAHTPPEEVSGFFAEMGRVAVELGNSAQEVVLSGDPRRAAEIDDEDDAMDELHGHLFIVLMDREWKHSVAAAMDVTLLGRFYERFADHAVEIGRRVIFQPLVERRESTFPSRVAANVGKVARTPTRCPRGHPLRVDRTIACSCGRRTIWRCHCGAVTYGPPLGDGCSLLAGAARVR
jgi:phosphate transport system protein